jgi:tRNA nucleotidyltransferase (CCA-adding enzyme)
MKVVLTHNNADCDAIASLLAMSKLEPEAIPVLPQRLNRNIAQFLLLYDRRWPMVPQEDVPRGDTVELAYVVDTQKFNSVRGMNPETPIYIIDHHSRNAGLPDHHTYTGEQTGANVTLLIEQMIERGLSVDSLEATLFLLGIYEDTGSLTYKSTTSRDLMAAAWLLNQAADLDVVREFLQHNMNEAQIRLFQTLEASAIVSTIKDYRVVITSTTVEEQVRESALIAHELIDLFQSDALLMVLQIRDDVQIIARASVDSIDLGALLREFEGNGHSRAAATLIRETSLEDILKQLQERLPEFIVPAIRVQALMSWGVQTIERSDSIGTAQTRMLESGHEGYPVLEKGQLVGLVTRRAVDRAMLHGMHKNTLSEIMDGNVHTVRPQDSIEILKDRILETGWGQMPVVNADGKLIGIVTRTDLIKHWGRRPGDEPQHEIEVVELLQEMLSPGVWSLLDAISQVAESRQEGLFLVGGIVRDLLLGRRNLDIDLVVEGDGIDLARAIQAEYGGELHTHSQFRTAKWRLDPTVAAAFHITDGPDVIDFATARAEFYEAPTVLPTVRTSSIKLDLHRRDFTINALAIRLAPRPMGQLLDFYHGERDLEDGILRVLHSLSFVDDPTRMLRAVRFEQRFGFQIEARTLEQMLTSIPLLDRLSGDRIRHEIELMLAEANSLKNFERLAELRILSAIHPDLRADDEIRRYFALLAETRKSPPWPVDESIEFWREAALALLTYHFTEESLDSFCARLFFSRAMCEPLQAVRELYPEQETLKELPLIELVERLERENEIVWLVLWMTASTSSRAHLEKFVTQWRHIKPLLRGDDLLKMGFKPGPIVGQILRELRSARLEGQMKEVEDERAYVRQRLQTHGA